MAQKFKIVEINPFDNEHIKKIENIELQNPELDLSSKLKEISKNTETEHKQAKRNSNDIDELIALEENSKIKGLFSINGEKDIRSCIITIYYVNQCQPKTLISIGTEYALSTLKMQEVFVKVKSTDRITKKHLEDMGYECLGEESGQTIYLKDQSINSIDENIMTLG